MTLLQVEYYQAFDPNINLRKGHADIIRYSTAREWHAYGANTMALRC